jgi:hypothetical protein
MQLNTLCCIYHPNHGMRVVDDNTAERLVSSNKWFYTEKQANIAKEQENEGQIRRKEGQGIAHSKQSPKDVRNRTQSKKRICKESSE